MKLGSNFSSNGWSYSISNIDFRAFMEDYPGTVITFCPHAVSIDKPAGYQDYILANVKRLATVAYNEYGVEVIIGLHTHMSSSQLPYYMNGSFATVFSDPTARQKWLDLVEHVSNYIQGTPGLRVFHMMNEPSGYLIPFLALWPEMKARCPSDMTVSIRLAEPALRIYNYDTRIHEIWDEVTINAYIDPWSPAHWTTQAQFLLAAQWARASGKPFIIGEFGSKTTNDSTQTNGIRNHIDLFREEEVEIAQAWIANPDVSTENTGWNLFKLDGSNDARPAFYELISDIEPGGECMARIRNNKSTPLVFKRVTLIQEDIIIPAGDVQDVTVEANQELVFE